MSLKQVSKQFPGGYVALHGLNLSVEAGQFVALLGPSGCGKSTVLRLLAGLEQPSQGQVSAPALKAGARGSETAYVFQEPTLMPWASVFDNVWLPLRLQGLSRSQAAPAVRQVLATVGLSEFEQALPSELSGGMKMRTSIARALVTEPQHRKIARWLLGDAGPGIEEDEVVIVEESSHVTCGCSYPVHIPPGDIEEVCVIVCEDL
jgi:NitT/TauT family transport system ATP-binding protein